MKIRVHGVPVEATMSVEIDIPDEDGRLLERVPFERPVKMDSVLQGRVMLALERGRFTHTGRIETHGTTPCRLDPADNDWPALQVERIA